LAGALIAQIKLPTSTFRHFRSSFDGTYKSVMVWGGVGDVAKYLGGKGGEEHALMDGDWMN
jgi:hypothetical protein